MQDKPPQRSSQSRHAACSMWSHAASQLIWGGRERLLERTCLAGGWPVLVLNADFRPLSYYPLSLWSWQDAIKAVFLDRVNIVEHYDPRGAQPVVRNSVAERGVAEILCAAVDASRLHPVQRIPARPLRLPVLLGRRRPHLRPHRAALQGRPDHLGKRRSSLLAVQSAQGQSDAAAGADVPQAGAVRANRAPAASQRPLFPPNYLHDSWLDILYWDTELDP